MKLRSRDKTPSMQRKNPLAARHNATSNDRPMRYWTSFEYLLHNAAQFQTQALLGMIFGNVCRAKRMMAKKICGFLHPYIRRIHRCSDTINTNVKRLSRLERYRKHYYLLIRCTPFLRRTPVAHVTIVHRTPLRTTQLILRRSSQISPNYCNLFFFR